MTMSSFATFDRDGRLPPLVYGQTLQQHEDTHAYFGLLYISYAWYTVSTMEGRCVCPDCFDAWLEWSEVERNLAYDMCRWYTCQLDTSTYGSSYGTTFPSILRQRSEEARLRPEIIQLTALASKVEYKIKQECELNCKDFDPKEHYPTPITFVPPPNIPMLPSPYGGLTIFK